MTALAQPVCRVAKMLVAGGFGVGKTTAIGAVSDITPLRTEEILTVQSSGVDRLAGVEGKDTTTVAFDFGRVGLDDPDGSDPVEVYLFGTPGQPRFWGFWDDLAEGAHGAVVLADTRRLESSFPAADFFEQRGLPFVIAVNVFSGTKRRKLAEVREAFDVDTSVPVMFCDARDADSVAGVLITLAQYAVTLHPAHSALLDAR